MVAAYLTTRSYEHIPLSKAKGSRSPLSGFSPPITSTQSLSLASIAPILPIQRKLKIGASNDRYEQEADRVAEQVMRMPDSAALPDQSSPPRIQRLCPEGEQGLQRQAEEAGQFQSRASTGQTPAMGNNAAAAIQSLKGSGQQLPASEQHFFESRFHKDFSQVRIHTDNRAHQAAQLVQARAFTLGNDIVFNRGEYAPLTNTGRSLLAHELTHVVQQSRTHKPLIQRQQQRQRQAYLTLPQAIDTTTSEQNRWRRRIDSLVRQMFGLRGSGLSSARVDFVSQAELNRRLPSENLEENLFEIFVDVQFNSIPYQILDHNRLLIGRDTHSGQRRIREFVRQGIAQNEFTGRTREYQLVRDPQSGEIEGQPAAPFTVRPRELLGGRVAGFASISGPRRGRSVSVVRGGFVETLIHEAVHFYVSNTFRDMADAYPQRDDYLYGSKISQILYEGFAEYFARRVMEAYPRILGGVVHNAYQNEVEIVQKLIITMGESGARQAYFRGNRRQIQRLFSTIAQYQQTPQPLLVPGFMID